MLEKIILTNFKNYPSFEFSLKGGINCITGLNGIGKTNLLDAIYFICIGKSAFSMDRNLILDGESFFRLEAKMSNHRLVAKYQARKKVLELDDKPYEKLTDHVGKFPAILSAPEDQKIILGGSIERRRFMDSSLAQTNTQYLRSLTAYNKVLKLRNAALKNMQESGRPDKDLIKVYNQQIVPLGLDIHKARTAFFEDFTPTLKRFYSQVSNDKEAITLKYITNVEPEAYLQQLEERFQADYFAGRTGKGVHKDSIQFYLNDKNVKDFASQGQTKSVLLALRFAQFSWIKDKNKKAPIFLIDDIYDKLDDQRVFQLLKMLSPSTVSQVIITDTNAGRLSTLLEKLDYPYQIEELN